MTRRELWKRRLGPLWGGALALSTSSALPMPELDAPDDAPAATWMVVSGLVVAAAAYAMTRGLAALGAPPSLAAAVGAVAMIFASGAALERAAGAAMTRLLDAAAGTAAISSVVVVRALAFSAVGPNDALVAFAAAAVMGRWSAALLQGLGDPIIDPVDLPRRSLVTAPPAAWELVALTAGVAVAAYLAVGGRALIALVASAAAAFALGLSAQRRRGGLDAHTVGVAALAGELAAISSVLASA